MNDSPETASEALGTSLLIGLETHIQGGELSMGPWERPGRGRLFSAEHTRGWKLVSPICRKPLRWGIVLDPSFLQHLDFQAMSNHPSYHGSAPWRVGSPWPVFFAYITCPKGGPISLHGSSSWSVMILPARAVVGRFWE